jgi:protein gp37
MRSDAPPRPHGPSCRRASALDGRAGLRWMGVSVEHQRYAFRARHLKLVPAAVRFVSAEPLVGPLTLDLDGIGWLIVGGESGKDARPLEPAWARTLRDHCEAAGVPFLQAVRRFPGQGRRPRARRPDVGRDAGCPIRQPLRQAVYEPLV